MLTSKILAPPNRIGPINKVLMFANKNTLFGMNTYKYKLQIQIDVTERHTIRV